MTGAHIRILPLIAQQRQRDLRERRPVDDHRDATSITRAEDTQ
jgi:hypothetical protein